MTVGFVKSRENSIFIQGAVVTVGNAEMSVGHLYWIAFFSYVFAPEIFGGVEAIGHRRRNQQAEHYQKKRKLNCMVRGFH